MILTFTLLARLMPVIFGQVVFENLMNLFLRYLLCRIVIMMSRVSYLLIKSRFKMRISNPIDENLDAAPNMFQRNYSLISVNLFLNMLFASLMLHTTRMLLISLSIL